MKKVGIIILGMIAVLAGLVILLLAWLYISYPADYVTRVLQMRGESVYDYQVFPERVFAASASPFRFEDAPDEDQVRSVFEQSAEVDDLDQFLADNSTQAFVVIQNDAILYEKYFNGAQHGSIVTSFSVAKSFASALIGIAIADGYIQSADDPITDYLPELAVRDPAFENISIDDLLRMSSGIKYVETSFVNGDDAKTYYSPDLRKLALEETNIIDLPGEYFLYNNYHPLLLGMIIERATGTTVGEYLEQKIWQPIGAEFEGSWSTDSEATQFEKMESGINGRAIDFAKFGRLYLNEGDWSGVQVVPSEWVAASTHPDRQPDNADYYAGFPFFAEKNGYYGYMWWGIRRGDQEYDYAAVGNRGQFIYIAPSKDLIIVRHGEDYGEFGSFDGWMQLFFDFASKIEPATGQ